MGRLQMPLLSFALSLVSLSAAALGSKLSPVLKLDQSFPPELLSAGIANIGLSFRTAALLSKLRAGDPVTMLVLGGSTVNRHGGCTDALIKCEQEAALAENRTCCGLVEVSDDESSYAQAGAGWARMFIDHLQEAFPPSQGRRHVLYNAGVVAAGNEALPYLSCWLPRLPRAFDLALIETHVFDAYNRPPSLQSEEDASFEHLVRRLLTWNGLSPVVMLTPFFNWCHSPEWAISTPVNHQTGAHLCRARPTDAKTITSIHTPFLQTGGGYEDLALTAAQYYGIPAVSIRNALFNWLAVRGAGAAPTWRLPQDVTLDGTHPTVPAQRLWANLLAHWWRVVAALHDGFEGGDTPIPLPPPVTRVAYGTYACYGARDTLRELPTTVDGAFEWGGYSEADAGKQGWVGQGVGAAISVTLDTRLHLVPGRGGEAGGGNGAGAEKEGGRAPFVGVELLHWAGEGAAEVSVKCSHGCKCSPTSVATKAEQFALPMLTHVVTTEDADCVVTLTVGAGGGKVVFTGLTVGESEDGTAPGARAIPSSAAFGLGLPHHEEPPEKEKGFSFPFSLPFSLPAVAGSKGAREEEAPQEGPPMVAAVPDKHTSMRNGQVMKWYTSAKASMAG